MSRIQLLCSSIAVGALLATVPLTRASALSLFTNPSFEIPALSAGTVTNFNNGTTIGAGWVVVGPSVLLIQNTYSESNPAVTTFNAGDGLNSVDLTGAGNQGPTAGVTQTVNLVVGNQYTLDFLVGRADPGPPYGTPSTVNVSINGTAPGTFTNSNSTPNAINWKNFAYTFTATQVSNSFTFLNGTSDNNFVGLDLVNLNDTTPGPVPEPGAMALLLGSTVPASLFAMKLRKRRR